MFKVWQMRPVRAAEGEGAGGAGAGEGAGGGTAGAAAAAAAAADGQGGGDGAKEPVAKWFMDKSISDEERSWLTAKGLALDDPLAVVPKLMRGHRSAEQHIGKGIERIIERPGEGQPFAEWARANAEALGLPGGEDGYAVEPPDFWPKDMPWNNDLDAKARKIALEKGVHPEAHKAYVELFAENIKNMAELADQEYATANQKMMGDLEREFGAQTPAVITRAKQAAQMAAEKAGLDSAGLEALSGLLSQKVGDAMTIRFMAAIGGMMGEDAAVGLTKGGALTITPAEAAQQFAQFTAPDGAWAKAALAGDSGQIAALRPEFDRLARAAAKKG